MKKLISLIAILAILLTAASVSGSGASVLNERGELVVNPITPKNDAFHGKSNHLSCEWWYFDAVFDSSYGAHLGIRVFSFGKLGLVQQLVNIYNNSKVEEKVVTMKPLKQFQISEEYPDVKYKDEQLIKFDYDEYNRTGNWNYTITVDAGKIKLNLTFVGISEGFTYSTSHEAWTVAQPKADVFGTITVNGKELGVTGTGYHDHNWNFTLRTAVRATGWYWGKIMSENYSLTWAKIQKTRFGDETIAENLGILSTLNEGFIGIDPDNISFTTGNYKFHTARFIPTEFSLYAKQDDVEINVNLKAVEIQHTEPDFLTINYWRYFISVDGYIKVGENIDYLENDLQIIEVIRFI